jgi:phage baseplate assembly protein W
VAEEFVGSGLAFPLRTDATGNLALASRERKIEESIRLVLGTAPGERPMRPEFGCRIHEFVFSPADESTAGLIAHEVRASLARWEPRIAVEDVDVRPAAGDRSLLYIDIRYGVKHTNDPRNLVFPFYVIPSEDGGQGRGPVPTEAAA